MLSFLEVRNLFEANGISVAEWSRDHGFPSALVYRVLRGEAKCRRGETHKIAIALGIKPKASHEQRKQLEIINHVNQSVEMAN
ncbi:MAG: DNA-binding protein [Methylotenera sp.]|uniref:DNA-binding protein n=1 Tax=Methylotenera sp. TaxID=2051956 RepID=UPI00271F5DB8|nr:DNA-binding protein [Methylotenera sp.]MDO9151039.1 DNA-binding protein [Methylotenera sp.]MDP3777760.1 DNA-binding protein [Methylotenera sp.]